jgi:glycyl-tRNA synthetase
MGVDRLMLMTLVDSYDEEDLEGRRYASGDAPFTEQWPRIKSRFCRSAKKLEDKANEVLAILNQHFLLHDAMSPASIGKRYRRQDEIGTPYLRDDRFRYGQRSKRDDPRP